MRLFLIAFLSLADGVETQGAFDCVVIEATEISDVGSAQRHVLAEYFAGEAFSVNRGAGRNDLVGVENSTYPKGRVIDRGSEDSGFKAIAISSAVVGMAGSARNTENLAISTFTVEPFPLLLTQGTNQVFSGLCRCTD